jgi:hypothetical protein
MIDSPSAERPKSTIRSLTPFVSLSARLFGSAFSEQLGLASLGEEPCEIFAAWVSKERG